MGNNTVIIRVHVEVITLVLIMGDVSYVFMITARYADGGGVRTTRWCTAVEGGEDSSLCVLHSPLTQRSTERRRLCSRTKYTICERVDVCVL